MTNSTIHKIFMDNVQTICKYGRSFHFDKDIECMKLYDATQGLCFEKDFYCKNWEQK